MASITSKGKARNFLKLMKSRRFVLWIHFLQDITSIMQKLSLLFQNKTYFISETSETLEDTIELLELYGDQDSPSVAKLTQGDTVADFRFHDIQLTEGVYDFERNRKEFSNNLVLFLKDRFRDLLDQNKKNVLAAISVFNIRKFPHKEKEPKNLSPYGDEEIAALCSYFQKPLQQAGINCDSIKQEWPILRKKIWRFLSTKQTINNQEIWSCLWSAYHEQLFNVLSLADLILSLQPHSAECERGFSLYKLIHTDLRNGLKPDTVSDLMRVRFQTPDIKDFNPLQSYLLWEADGKSGRRQEVSPYGPRKTTVESHDTVSEPEIDESSSSSSSIVNITIDSDSESDNMSDY